MRIVFFKKMKRTPLSNNEDAFQIESKQILDIIRIQLSSSLLIQWKPIYHINFDQHFYFLSCFLPHVSNIN